jgi:hypothetical protein
MQRLDELEQWKEELEERWDERHSDIDKKFASDDQRF